MLLIYYQRKWNKRDFCTRPINNPAAKTHGRYYRLLETASARVLLHSAFLWRNYNNNGILYAYYNNII